ncbi:sirohydrochlorin chelatase [Gordonia sinesedis]
MSETLLLVAHGSRDPRFGDTARRIRSTVAARLHTPSGAPDVRLAFLDLDEPSVAAELTALTGPCTVVPLLLAPGYHSEIDLPGIVADHAAHSVRCTDVVGTRSVTAALADRLEEAGLRSDDGIVLTAVGSTNPAAALVVQRRAVELSTMLLRPVEVVYATRLGVEDAALRNAIRRLRSSGSERVVVSPYFLSAGLLTERVDTALDRLAPGSMVAGPIGTHPALIDAVVDAYRDAVPSEVGVGVIAGR